MQQEQSVRYGRTSLFEVLESLERSQAWLARRIGCSESLVSLIKSGDRVITEDFARRASVALGLPKAALFFDPILAIEGNTLAMEAEQVA